MSPLKDFFSSSFDKEPAALASVNRRNKAIPTDSAPARFFYAMLRQLDLKNIDWNLVASENEISNGHAARMRYHRFRNQIENIQPQKRKSKANKTSKKSRNPLKAGLQKELSPDIPSPVIKTEQPYYRPIQPKPCVKNKGPYTQDISLLSDIPQYAPPMVTAQYLPSYYSAFSSPMAPPFDQMNLDPQLRGPSLSSSMPSYPPVPQMFQQRHPSPVSWTPMKVEPRNFSEEGKDVEDGE
ncbi:uncharacterized protein BDV14DRAFT_204840 [Aspergillus stella-maris]|uniref:uncharacterized protein n=1 Tax=Aspergillus stella-maris TaxID=1810926 RepID=UPI003CCE0E53